MTDWVSELDRNRAEFLERMRQLGFVVHDEETRRRETPVLVGRISHDGSEIEVAIEVRDGFPYRQPRVRPTEPGADRSWHQERDGALCLWSGNEDDLPWTDAGRLVDRVTTWFEQAEAGWPDHEPALDLERYFDKEPGTPLVLYDRIDDLVGGRIKIRHGETVRTLELESSTVSRERIRAKHGWGIDVGELDQPITDWQGIADHLGNQRADIEGEFRGRGKGWLFLAYSRAGYRGAVLLRVHSEGGELILRALESASRAPDVVEMRAGRDAEKLSEKSAALVGLGAIGSFLAELLTKDGIGELILCDGELLRPGNCVRHLAGPAEVGKPKVEAVRDVLEAQTYGDLQIRTEPGHLRQSEQAAGLAADVDLLLDATGNPRIASLLADAARHARTPCLSVYAQRDGGVVRVDRWPLNTGESHPEAIPAHTEAAESTLREAGCGDPVSPTPPHSVVAAAALAASAAVDVLCDRPLTPSMIQILHPQPDSPYDQRGVLT